ncbi:MAG: tRNA (adenosine(37)-N6)-threonylcarbamoyltransferase complex ATPase subunit type 1 TsaE [Phycisphaerales bacterium]
MLRFERESESVERTGEIARDVALVVRAGDVIRLDGPMGAGKTTFVRALAGAMGADVSLVSSPTFVLVNEYPTKGGRPDLVHMDCYRMSGADELDDLGWDRILSSGAAVVIEWAERIGAGLPASVARVAIEPTGETDRVFTIEVPDSWDERPGVLGLEARRATVCPVTGRPVAADSPTWPFADERARLSDLHGWLTDRNVISRAIEERDLDEGVD